MPLKVECVVNGGMHAQEPLGGARRFEALHLALSSSHHLVRVLGPIVLSQALLMVAGKPEVLEGSAVGAQLIRDHPFRREAVLSHQFSHELDGSAPVSSALSQDIEDLALMVNRTPQVHPLARNPDDHLVKMPSRWYRRRVEKTALRRSV